MTPQEFEARRLALQLSIRDLAHMMGVHHTSVERWRKGTRPIPDWVDRMLSYISVVLYLSDVASAVKRPGRT